MPKITLYNEKQVRLYLKSIAGESLQVAGDFWPALEARIKRLLDLAVKRNGKHRRITAGELQIP